ncbi:MAG: hypothetical protein OJF59_003122 [Cytophagales bacterium]|jgi:hypothetical protein|nr:hypothetical protein [Bacteroidota bacterium]MBS1981918.1 hypothetical protein [Bacteroidota bacterium]WHZ09366.1 MAG: hypothetical protein OJF59_003122 [Cytophagales bacterium]
MKTKIIGIIGVTALLVLSLAFAPKGSNKKEQKVSERSVSISEPVGGFMSEDK